jgi:hypothetical protein
VVRWQEGCQNQTRFLKKGYRNYKNILEKWINFLHSLLYFFCRPGYFISVGVAVTVAHVKVGKLFCGRGGGSAKRSHFKNCIYIDPQNAMHYLLTPPLSTLCTG